MRTKAILACLIAANPLSLAAAQTPHDVEQTIQSATIARDINGFSLGMPISEVRQITELSHVAFETFSATHDGVEYDFGFTPLGRIFRIQSRQTLGNFEPDPNFTRSLNERLTQKYGTPTSNQLPSGPASWGLVEPVAQADGSLQPSTVMRVSARLSRDRGVQVISMFMLDFRVLWADQVALNERPRQDAQDRVRF